MKAFKFVLAMFFFILPINILSGEEIIKDGEKDNKTTTTMIQKSDSGVPRSVLIIPFYNMTPRKSEFGFLSEALRDSITSRLQNLDQFYFVNALEITNAMKKMGFEPDSMNELNNALRLASQLKADILVVGKFYILENKVMISTRSYDMVDFQDVVSSVEGNSGVDIFVLVDAISSDMARKMQEKYPKMEEFKSSNELFAANYAGVKLGDEYSYLKSVLENSKFKATFYPDKKMMFINGYISDAFKTDLVILYFDSNNRLSNIYIDALSVKQELKKITITDQKQRMIRVFGEKYKNIGDDNYFWEGRENSFELINRFTHQGEIRMFYHFFNNKNKVNFDTFEKDINFFKKDGFEFSIGGGLNSFFTFKSANSLIFKDDGDYNEERNFSFPIKIGFFLPISFTYVYNRDSIGFSYLIGYEPGFVSKLFFAGPMYYLGTFNMSLALRMKFVDKKKLYLKNVIEIGAHFETEWLYDRDNVDTKYYRKNPDDLTKYLIKGDFNISLGPVFRFGQEIRYGNFTYEPYFVFGATFGTENINYNGKKYEFEKVTNEEYYKKIGVEPPQNRYFMSNIFIGHEIRFSYYKVSYK